MDSKKKRPKSIATELVIKAQEAALAAVQVYNSPSMTFKSELFIVIMNIAWTYLLHAHFRKQGIDYRYEKPKSGSSGTRRRFQTSKFGSYRYWDLEKCLTHPDCPVDDVVKENLRFLLGIRHEIEHQMTQRIDHALSAKFQANCLNFNSAIKKLFGAKNSIERHLTFSLQFSSISPTQKDLLLEQDLPAHISSFISKFEADLPEEKYSDSRYSFRVMFIQKTTNKKGQADRVIEFAKPGDAVTAAANATYEQVYLKEIDKKKYRATEIIKKMNEEGYKGFSMKHHTILWKELDARNPAKGFAGHLGTQWYWFESWLNAVRNHCEKNAAMYR